jgi:hypothetical protein
MDTCLNIIVSGYHILKTKRRHIVGRGNFTIDESMKKMKEDAI